MSLLEGLRLRPGPAGWHRLVDLYTPLVRAWLCRYGVPSHDVDDLTQEVFGAVVRDLPDFRHNARTGALRSWLRTITVHRLRNYWRNRNGRPVAVGGSGFDEALAQLEDPAGAFSRLWDAEHDRHVLMRLLDRIQPEFEPTTWQAFRILTLEGKPTAAVAKELGLSANAVRIAKSRVLRRLREAATENLDENDGSPNSVK
jgi:RNA polymerase sigma-70 factor (ECF subfamily)